MSPFARTGSPLALEVELPGSFGRSAAREAARPAAEGSWEAGSGPDWFTECYARHSEFIHALVRRLGCQPAEADDLTQEVFLVAYRKYGRRGPPLPLRSTANWLYGVAVRVVSDARGRERLRHALHWRAAGDPSLLGPEANPAGILESREANALVWRLLDRLTQKKREVFVLFEIEQLSGKEVAEVLGIPLKNVWARLIHARRAFRRALRAEQLRQSPLKDQP